MNTQTSLPTAILSFAFTGVLGPHPRPVDYTPTRTQTVTAPARPR